MSWFKENKFLGGLIVITLVLAGVIIFFGLKKQGELEDKVAEIEAKEASLKDDKGLDPYPTPENAKEKEANLRELIANANEMQAKFLSFRPESLAPIPVNEFSARLKSAYERVVELYEGKASLPDSFYLGFEVYQSQLPTPESTGELAYELEAIEWLLGELNAAKITELGSIVRQQIPSEKGESWDGAANASPKGKPRGRGGRSARGGAAPKRGSSLPKVAHRMPIEITFKGPESALRKVLTAMADSDQYFFETRVARFQNGSPIPTAPRSARVAVDEPVSDAGFGSVEGDEPEGGDEAQEASRRILDRVAGGDDIAAYLRVDLLLFTDEPKFPAIK